MGHWEWIQAAASVGGLVVAAGMISVAIVGTCRSGEDKVARFGYGHLGASRILLALGSGLFLVAVAAPYVESSGSALAAVLIVNVAFQPIALLFCWAGFRKVTLGLSGRVGYAWREVTESELADCPPSTRRQLARYCVVQGLVALPFGAGLSYGCAWPLLQWAVA